MLFLSAGIINIYLIKQSRPRASNRFLCFYSAFNSQIYSWLTQSTACFTHYTPISLSYEHLTHRKIENNRPFLYRQLLFVSYSVDVHFILGFYPEMVLKVCLVRANYR